MSDVILLDVWNSFIKFQMQFHQKTAPRNYPERSKPERKNPERKNPDSGTFNT
jgi:hypothetical protein